MCGRIKPRPRILFHLLHHMTEAKHALLLNCDVLAFPSIVGTAVAKTAVTCSGVCVCVVVLISLLCPPSSWIG